MNKLLHLDSASAVCIDCQYLFIILSKMPVNIADVIIDICVRERLSFLKLHSIAVALYGTP